MPCWPVQCRGLFVLSRSAWLFALVGNNTSIYVAAAVLGSATALLSLMATGRPSFPPPPLAAGSTLQHTAGSDTATGAPAPGRHSGQPVPFRARQDKSAEPFSRMYHVRQANNPTILFFVIDSATLVKYPCPACSALYFAA